MVDIIGVPHQSRRRTLPRLLVRLRRAWRGACELCAFIRAATTALMDFARGRWA